MKTHEEQHDNPFPFVVPPLEKMKAPKRRLDRSGPDGHLLGRILFSALVVGAGACSTTVHRGSIRDDQLALLALGGVLLAIILQACARLLCRAVGRLAAMSAIGCVFFVYIGV